MPVEAVKAIGDPVPGVEVGGQGPQGRLPIKLGSLSLIDRGLTALDAELSQSTPSVETPGRWDSLLYDERSRGR